MSNVYSVSQINAYIKNMFVRDGVLSHICIKGEVSNCKYHSSGHIYFSIKDVNAQINCVMFLRDRQSGLSFKLENGQSIIACGRISFYERDGAVNMYVTEITSDGYGRLYEQYEKLKKQLLDEGLFDRSHKKTIPPYIKKLGIVTASTGAALRDILNITKRRNPYVQPVLYPAKVQGDGAAQSIVKAIRALDDYGVDVIIVGRGGGSIEDLWAFNEEIVARCVYECRTPVVSAVGHETDTTIIDYVSDLRAPTPSAAAELCVYEYSLFQSAMVDMHADLVHYMINKINLYRERVDAFSKAVNFNSPSSRLSQHRQFIDDISERMSLAVRRNAAIYNARLDDYTERIKKEFYHKLDSSKRQLEMLSEIIGRNSPLNRLSGGYGYVSSDNRPVNSINDVSAGDRLDIILKDGKVNCRVEDTVEDTFIKNYT
ncbi:MAG: exodeoxyribonuclease VII large subunit [Clostridiales bacterium]|nr:exodeoxyribonuclease VII large subunit [Clostridiales bacterium]